MSSKTSSKSRVGRSENGKSGPSFRYVNYDLSTAEKEELGSFDLEVEFSWQRIDEVVAEGYKCSFSYDEHNNCCIASLTDKRPGSDFELACLTGRGATPFDAWCSVLYRHFHLAQGDWHFFDNPGNRYVSRFS